MNAEREEEMDRKLSKAIQNMEEALERANGECTRKLRRRTTKVRRELRKLAEEPPIE